MRESVGKRLLADKSSGRLGAREVHRSRRRGRGRGQLEKKGKAAWENIPQKGIRRRVVGAASETSGGCCKRLARSSCAGESSGLLVFSVVGIECFWLAIFPIPNNVLDHIVKLCRAFLWGGRRKPLVAWNEVCILKDEGGLGVFDLKAWNMTLLSKTLWNVQAKKDSLWSIWVHHVYLRGVNIWDASSKHDDSPLFKKVIIVKNQILMKCDNQLDIAEKLVEEWDLEHKSSTQCYNSWRHKACRVAWCNVVWKSGSTPKHAFTLLLDIKGKLPTCDNQVGFDGDLKCGFCKELDESIDHIFFKCKYSSHVWDYIRSLLGISRSTTSLKEVVKWLHREEKGKAVKASGSKIVLATTVYFLWHFKNRKRFEEKSITPEELIGTMS
ncbi:uncharacterized protein LOC131145838 [Malania oleifera]|uniref:uncharacterized protein LOC131145838 n=1 Tax=Malania oleifera TaxID=397392 RepID=UPI0025AE7D3B|nr:uncharacterized protein LOC131145838 [Malania oleifera]